MASVFSHIYSGTVIEAKESAPPSVGYPTSTPSCELLSGFIVVASGIRLDEAGNERLTVWMAKQSPSTPSDGVVTAETTWDAPEAGMVSAYLVKVTDTTALIFIALETSTNVFSGWVATVTVHPDTETLSMSDPMSSFGHNFVGDDTQRYGWFNEDTGRVFVHSPAGYAVYDSDGTLRAVTDVDNGPSVVGYWTSPENSDESTVYYDGGFATRFTYNEGSNDFTVNQNGSVWTGLFEYVQGVSSAYQLAEDTGTPHVLDVKFTEDNSGFVMKTNTGSEIGMHVFPRRSDDPMIVPNPFYSIRGPVRPVGTDDFIAVSETGYSAGSYDNWMLSLTYVKQGAADYEPTDENSGDSTRGRFDTLAFDYRSPVEAGGTQGRGVSVNFGSYDIKVRDGIAVCCAITTSDFKYSITYWAITCPGTGELYLKLEQGMEDADAYEWRRIGAPAPVAPEGRLYVWTGEWCWEWFPDDGDDLKKWPLYTCTAPGVWSFSAWMTNGERTE